MSCIVYQTDKKQEPNMLTKAFRIGIRRSRDSEKSFSNLLEKA